jgi:hypothetical protein
MTKPDDPPKRALSRPHLTHWQFTYRVMTVVGMVLLPTALVIAATYVWAVMSKVPGMESVGHIVLAVIVVAVLGPIALMWVGWCAGMIKEVLTVRPRATEGWGVACRNCGTYGDPEYKRRRPSTPPRCPACGSANTETYGSISLGPKGRPRRPWAVILLILAVAAALAWAVVAP